MVDSLVIFAAGKSSRFGGFPKAFCDLGGMKNVENTISLAKSHFNKIYLVVNKETFASGITEGIDAEIISIVTGQGDADSILKALRIVGSSMDKEILCGCWGDAVFLTDEPFTEIERGISEWSIESPALVGCSIDSEPYAWFDVDGSQIICSHFRKREKQPRDFGLHDQSIFAFHACILEDYLMQRKRELGLDRYDEDTYDSARGEMGLLDSFTWFYNQPDKSAAEFCWLTSGKVMSFNTPAELEQIVDRIKKLKSRRGQGIIC